MKKNNRILICTLIALGFILICTNSCKKEESKNNQTSTLATIVTDSVTNITDTSATCGGNITNDGGSTISARGVCWSTNKNPTINDDSLTIDGTGKGIFTSNITGLTGNLTYYVRAYAYNSIGIRYGSAMSFKTKIAYGKISDVDGNTYKTVVIGTQPGWLKT